MEKFDRLRPDTMARVFDPELGHLAFDDTWIAAIASRGQGRRGHVGQELSVKARMVR